MLRSVTRGWGAVVVGVALTCTVPTAAQWTATSLHPVGASSSYGNAARRAVQGGYAIDTGGLERAQLWTSSGSVELSPAGANQSRLLGLFDGRQFGFARFGATYHAGFWSGTATSWVDLHPAGASESRATSGNAAQQAGFVTLDRVRASLWSGTAASRVDLHPTGAAISRVNALAGQVQSGYARFNQVDHAGLWTGSSASWVDLHPVGSSGSQVLGSSDGRQVGFAIFADQTRAAMWSGTADSLIDLNPANSTFSRALGSFDQWQVGESNIGGLTRASLWSGSAASFVDLNAFLPAQYISATATGISSDGTSLFITGYAFNIQLVRTEAMLWTAPIPSPSAAGVLGLGLVAATRRRRTV